MDRPLPANHKNTSQIGHIDNYYVKPFFACSAMLEKSSQYTNLFMLLRFLPDIYYTCRNSFQYLLRETHDILYNIFISSCNIKLNPSTMTRDYIALSKTVSK